MGNRRGSNGSKQKVRVTNRTTGEVILQEAELAESFWKRLLGLLKRNSLEPGKGMVIRPCRAVHTLGMAFSIDVGFVDEKGCLCLLLEKMKPGRFSPTVKEASYVIEAPAGTFQATGTELNDKISLEQLDSEGDKAAVSFLL